MLRELITGQWGEEISQTTAGTLYQQTFTYNIPNDYNDVEVVLEHLEDVAFLTETHQELISGSRGSITFTSGPDPLTAEFIADETQVCEAGFVWFTSTSLGDPVEYEWLFPGGNPSSSMDEEPFSYYENLGAYDVTLIVRDAAGDRDTLTKTTYINVSSEPDVQFGEIEDLCDEDWDPYELVTGSPAGGSYSGDHVSDGKFFHPTAAGVGSYTLYYTYTDAACGSFTSEQIVQVVSWVGIDEKTDHMAVNIFPNPSSGKLTLTLETEGFYTADIKVMDAMGKLVYERDGLSANGSYTAEIDLSQQAQGVYFVLVSTNDKQMTRKIFLNK